MSKWSVIGALALVACAGEPDVGDPAPVAGVHGDDGEAVSGAVPVAREELARIQIDRGELVFYAIHGAAGDEVAMLEVSRPDADGLVSSLEPELSPLAAYLAFTGDDVPVPRALIAAETRSEVRSAALRRAETDRLTAPIARAALAVDPPVAETSIAELCSGTTSAEFADEVCTTYDYWNVNFCHNGTWFSVTDGVGSSQKMQWSRSRTLACGANGRVRHNYKLGGIWYEPIDELIPSGTLHTWTYEGSVNLERKITHSRTASGFVRGSSHFRDF